MLGAERTTSRELNTQKNETLDTNNKIKKWEIWERARSGGASRIATHPSSPPSPRFRSVKLIIKALCAHNFRDERKTTADGIVTHTPAWCVASWSWWERPAAVANYRLLMKLKKSVSASHFLSRRKRLRYRSKAQELIDSSAEYAQDPSDGSRRERVNNAEKTTNDN